MNTYCLFVRRVATVLILATASTQGSAALISINSHVTGENPGVTATVATISLTQNGSDVDFLLTNSIANLGIAASNDSCISDLAFTFSQNSVLTPTSFTNFGGTQTPTVTSSDFAINPAGSFQGGYDFFLELSFPTSNAMGGINRFKHGETASWTILNVNVADFQSPLVTGTGHDALAAVHIQSLASGQSTTYASQAVPEPCCVLPLAGLGMVGIYRRRRRRAEKR
tara:strand:+ start:285499 stop:286176 length:678 start_codon:yes stop_codon:yes gene_type:complete